VSLRPPRALPICGAALFGLTILGLYEQAHESIAGFVAVAAAQSAVYLVAARLAWNRSPSRRELAAMLTVAAVLRLPVVAAPPSLSTDIYRYIWDGRVAAAGINPYRHVPVDPRLAGLRDPEIFPQINRSNYAPTIYPPVAEGIFLAVTRLGERPVIMKTAMVGFEAAAVVLLLRLLASSGMPAGRVLVYAWHPLPLWEFAGSGHIDAALIALVVLALWAGRQERPWLSGIALAGAALVKLFPAVLLPALGRRDWRPAAGFAATMVVGYLPFVGAGWAVLGFLPGYAVEEGFTAGAGLTLLSLIRALPGFAELPTFAYLAGAVAVLGALAAAVFARGDDDAFSGAAALATAFMVLVSPHYPWYFAWLVVFACLAPLPSLLWLTTTSLLLYLVPVGSQLVRDHHRVLVEGVIYGPFAALAAFDLRRALRSRRA
jgi:hypothetical protein